MRGLRGADVGAHRDVHADVAGDAREDGTDHEAEGRQPAQGKQHHHADHRADDGDGGVLPVQIGTGAFLNGGSDFLHARVAGVLAQNPFDRLNAINQRTDGTD